MESESGRSLWDKVGKPIVILLSIILVLALTILIARIMNPPPNPLRVSIPTGTLEVEYNNLTNSYRLVVNSLNDDEDDLFEEYK